MGFNVVYVVGLADGENKVPPPPSPTPPLWDGAQGYQRFPLPKPGVEQNINLHAGGTRADRGYLFQSLK